MVTPIFDYAHPKNLPSPLNFYEFVSARKKSGHFMILFWRYSRFKILPEWSRAFWPISQESHFSQIWVLCRGIVNNTNFDYRTNSEKTNAQIFQYIQRTLFFALFPILGANFFFLSKTATLSCTTSYGFPRIHQNLEKKTIIGT